MDRVRIALVGDFDPAVTAHRAIPAALELSAARSGVAVAPDWIPTTAVTTADALADYAGIWCVPASPYASMDGALRAIRFARESRRPFLGTCGGFQHAVLEYVRHVLGHATADHAETDPDATMPVIGRLSCPLVEKPGRVRLTNGTLLRAAYAADEADETYHCRFGLNPQYERLLDAPAGLRVAARDEAGEVRAVELTGHPFFVATLFQPERAGLRGDEHPLVTAFVLSAAGRGHAEPGAAPDRRNTTGFCDS